MYIQTIFFTFFLVNYIIPQVFLHSFDVNFEYYFKILETINI